MSTPDRHGTFQSRDFITGPAAGQAPLIIPDHLSELTGSTDSLPLGCNVRFGPGSTLRKDLCDINNFFTIFSTGVLQLAHPVIGDAVDAQSRFFGSMWERFDSSTRAVAEIVLSDDATRAGHRVRNFHRHVWGTDIDGRRVHALDPEAYGWGWLTILRMIEEKKRRFDRPQPSPDDWEAWYQEGVAAYRCQGVTARHLPDSYEAYKEYFAEKCQTRLRRTKAADHIIGQLEAGEVERPPQIPPMLWGRMVEKSLAKYVRLLAFGGLPAEVRENLNISWKKSDQVVLNGLDWAVRNVWSPMLPERLGYHPALVRSLLPPNKPHQEVLCRLGEVFADLSFANKTTAAEPAVPIRSE